MTVRPRSIGWYRPLTLVPRKKFSCFYRREGHKYAHDGLFRAKSVRRNFGVGNKDAGVEAILQSIPDINIPEDPSLVSSSVNDCWSLRTSGFSYFSFLQPSNPLTGP